MIIPDINLLIYAHNESAPEHARAKAWWSECLQGYTSIGIPSIVILGFLRLSTSGRVYVAPMTIARAAGVVRSWLSFQNVSVLETNEAVIQIMLELITEHNMGGARSSDAQLAAHAIHREATIHTADADFRRMTGVKVAYPLEV